MCIDCTHYKVASFRMNPPKNQSNSIDNTILLKFGSPEERFQFFYLYLKFKNRNIVHIRIISNDSTSPSTSRPNWTRIFIMEQIWLALCFIWIWFLVAVYYRRWTNFVIISNSLGHMFWLLPRVRLKAMCQISWSCWIQNRM